MLLQDFREALDPGFRIPNRGGTVSLDGHEGQTSDSQHEEAERNSPEEVRLFNCTQQASRHGLLRAPQLGAGGH
ncbi:MAG TPA: hypothetical protein VF226_00540 [Hyphomicrobiaceae bacterium]